MAQATPQAAAEGPAFNRLSLTQLQDVVNPSGLPVSNIPDGATLSWNAGLRAWVVSNSL